MKIMVSILLFLMLNLSCSIKKEIKFEKDSINWSKFSSFNLPFKIIYDGPLLKNETMLPLYHGFSHVSLGSIKKEFSDKLSPKNRAINWTGIAYKINNPWRAYKSPWGNNLNLLNAYWNRRLNLFKDSFRENSKKLDIDILVLDIEASLRGENEILQLKSNEVIPENLKRLDDNRFIFQYKTAMQELYLQPIINAKTHLTERTKISSYGDVPVPRDWHGIEKLTWNEWKDAKISRRDLSTKENSSFYEILDFQSSSSYYFYKDGRNLAYCLFQIESNKALNEKPLYQFIWMRHTGKLYFGEPIKSSLAEATAIFPFFSGANGLWLWEKSTYKDDYTQEAINSYEAFIRGLERLSVFKDYFEDDFKLFIPKSARDHFVDRDPVWRGAIKNNKILIAAQNPYGKDTEQIQINISYKNWFQTITLTGAEVYLKEFKLK